MITLNGLPVSLHIIALFNMSSFALPMSGMLFSRKVSIFSGIFISLFLVLHLIAIFSVHHKSSSASLMNSFQRTFTVHMASGLINSSLPSGKTTLLTLK